MNNRDREHVQSNPGGGASLPRLLLVTADSACQGEVPSLLEKLVGVHPLRCEFWSRAWRRPAQPKEAPHGDESTSIAADQRSLTLRALAKELLSFSLPLAGLVVAVLGLNVHGGATLAADDQAGPAEIDVAIDGGVLSVKVHDAPLEDVLVAIADEARLGIKLQGDLTRPVTAWFALALEEGISRLVGPNSLIKIYAPVEGRADQPRLTEIRVSESSPERVATVEAPLQANPLDPVYQDLEGADRKSRLRAVRELYRRGDEAAVDDLALVLAQDEDRRVRKLAAFGLGKVGGPNTLSALAAGVEDKDRRVRIQAIRGLAKIGGEDSTEILTGALTDPDARVRLHAVRALWSLGDVRTAAALSEVLAEDKDPEVRRASVRTLAKLGGDEAWWALFDATADADPTVREIAAAALRRQR